MNPHAPHTVSSLPSEGAAAGAGCGPVAVVGAGNMGGGMVRRLLGQGWRVHVHDIDPEVTRIMQSIGAAVYADSASAAMNCVATIVCVVDAQQTREVLFGERGVVRGLAGGGAVLLCPTISPQDVEGFANELEALGLHAIDAPMSGGPVRAAEGSMSLMVACADAVFEAHGALLHTLSSKLFRISQRPGDGARTKLVNNLLAGINLAGAAEVLALAQRLGLDLSTTMDVIEQSSGQSWIGSDRMRRAIAGDYAPRAHTTLLAKDTRLAIEAAQAAGFDAALGALASGHFAQALQAGLGTEDDASLFKLPRAAG